MEPMRSQPSRLAWKLFWAFLIISLFPIGVMLMLAFVFSGEQLLELPAFLQQRLLIALIALTLTTIGLVWVVVMRHGRRVSALAHSVRQAAQGRPAESAALSGNDEIAEAAQWFNRLADQLAHQQALLMNQDNEENTTRRQAAALVAQQALMSGSLDDLLRSALDLFLRHFGCSFGALYLLESKELASKIYISLVYTAGSLSEELQPFAKRYLEKRINLDQMPSMDWMVGRALASRRPQSGPAAPNSPVYEAVLPLIQPSPDGPRIIGALDLLSTSRASDARVGPFSVRTVAEMQGIANVMALAIGGFTTAAAVRDGALPTHPGATQGSPRFGGVRLDVEGIYAAGSRIAQSQTVDQALNALRSALRNTPYASAILVSPEDAWAPGIAAKTGPMPADAGAAHGVMQVVVCRALRTQPPGMNEPPLVLPSPRHSALESFFVNRLEHENRGETDSSRVNPLPLLMFDLDLQADAAPGSDAAGELAAIARRMGCRSAAFLPALRDGKLAALLMVGASPETTAPLLRPDTLEPFQNLVQLAAAAFERIRTTAFTQRNLAEMETLWKFTQAISIETDLNVLLRLLHTEIEAVMGTIDSFAVALYDAPTNTVRIPYMHEGGQQLNIPTFPLGAGLSSEVIRTRKPLLLSSVEEVQKQSASTGAMLVGEEPRSWLGVPMIYAGEVVGVIIVQDTTQEGRFTPSDSQLLSTLAAQVAVVVRNARLLDASRRQARQERLVNEISDRIRRAVDVQAILKITADELATALGARRASIRIGLDGSVGLPEAAPESGAPASIDYLEGMAPWSGGSMLDNLLQDAVPTSKMARPAPRPEPAVQPEAPQASIQREPTRPEPPSQAAASEEPPAIEIPLVSEPLPPQAPPPPASFPQAPAGPAEDATGPARPTAKPQPPTGSQPAGSQPRSNHPAAFTLDLKTPPAGVHPPTGPRVSPFVEPEAPKPGAQPPAPADAQGRFQAANTAPLPNLPDPPGDAPEGDPPQAHPRKGNPGEARP